MATSTTLCLSMAEKRWWIFVVCLFGTLCFVPKVSSKWVQSSFDAPQDWKFITRFCFLSEKGRFDYVFKYPKSYGVQQLLLYYDKPGQWESVYKSSKNCSERRSVLSKVNNQIIDLTNEITDSRNAGCEIYNEDGVEYYSCTDRVTFSASRERWWYIVLARCERSEGGSTGLRIDYSIHMMNGDEDDILHHEMSADEFYILPVDISFLLVFIILLVLSIICAIVLMKRQMFHTTYKMYMAALCLWIFGLFLECIAWGRYGESGWEEKPTEVTGRLFRAASTAVFLLMLLLLAKGYTVTRGRLTTQSTLRLTIFFCLYCVVNISLFIWEGQFFDEGYVLYFYESPPGYGLIAMRIIAWLWFLYAFAFTIKHHPNKTLFYVPFFLFYTAWFFAGPIVTLIAIFAIAKWSREKTVNGVEQFVTLCGYLFFLVLTLPYTANKNFPFHLRVSQVRFSDDEEQEPAQTYGLSDESRQRLDSMFVVSDSASRLHSSSNSTSAPPSSTTYHSSRPPSHPSSSSSAFPQQNGGGGYVNGGFSASQDKGIGNHNHQNGSALSADGSQSVYTNSYAPPSYDDASQLPSLRMSALPPVTNDPADLPPPPSAGGRGGSELPPISNRGGSELPPLTAASSLQALPPLPSAGSRLPPLNGGRPVPAIFSASQIPSAPPSED